MAKGIATDNRRGRCTDEAGVAHIVVRRAGTVVLDDASIRLVKTYVTKSVAPLNAYGAPGAEAQGRFVILKLRVKNTGETPQFYSSGLGWASLEIDGTTYTADDSTAAFTKGYTVDGDPGLESGELQPGQTKTAWVAFDAMAVDAARLNATGSLLRIVTGENAQNGYDAAAETATQRGVIQLWN